MIIARYCVTACDTCNDAVTRGGHERCTQYILYIHGYYIIHGESLEREVLQCL